MIDNDTCQHYEHEISELNKEIYRLQQREKVLEQQLAEKDKEIEDRIKQVRTLYVQLYELQKAVEYCQEHHKKNKLTPLTLHNYTNEKHNQDKIDYAVEQLERVKKNLMRYAGAICGEDGSILIHTYVIRDNDFELHIDQLITEVKEGK